MRANFPNRRLVPAASAILLTMILAGCAAPPAPPFQARSYAALSAGAPPYGYADSQVDAWKYAVLYTDRDKVRARVYLELRAAQIARDEGFPYFVFDKVDTGAVTKYEPRFGVKQFQPAEWGRGAAATNPIDYVAAIRPVRVFQYYTAIGLISLLTAEQAQDNPEAIEAAPLLAVMAAPAKS